MTRSLQFLKEAFKAGPVRAYPGFKEGGPPFILTTDYSGSTISAILSQHQDGQERLIAATGKLTTPYKKNYSSSKGELAAVVYSTHKFEHLLKFQPFEIHTDAIGCQKKFSL